ncbi:MULTISPECIES: hypothetical protein [Streptomyces]|uniref:Uncharacterized protein n=2 Tax=Streptomyces TaxID=1883 RepID=A0A100Y905_9ACTN|nr:MULTISPECIES: hypothetical protein [Streptomyces]KUH39899.1 hypothetical protein ATE80_04920 [Streptomyces kanasensis]UUS32257.1 hypothetical protein NRO40_16505 [Streptomyces changanensis]
MRLLTSRRVALAAVCAALTLGTAGPALADAPQTRPDAPTAVAADTDATDDATAAVQAAVDELIASMTKDQATTGMPENLPESVQKLIDAVLGTVGGLTGVSMPDLPVDVPSTQLPQAPGTDTPATQDPAAGTTTPGIALPEITVPEVVRPDVPITGVSSDWFPDADFFTPQAPVTLPQPPAATTTG